MHWPRCVKPKLLHKSWSTNANIRQNRPLKNENYGSGNTSQMLKCLPRILDFSVAMINYQKQLIEKFILAYVAEGIRAHNSSKWQAGVVAGTGS